MLGLIAKPYPLVTAAGGSGEAATQTDFPTANAFNNDYGRILRTTTATSGGVYRFYVDLGANPPAVDVAGILWSNLRATDTVTINGGTSVANVLSGTGYTSGPLSAITGISSRDTAPPAKQLLTMSSSQVYRYWGFFVTLVGSALPAGYVQISRLMLGKKAIFVIGPQKASYDAVDMNSKLQLDSGDERTTEDEMMVRPMVSLDFGYARESEIASVVGGYGLSLGTSRPMLICPDLTATYLQDNIVFGRPEKIIALQSDIYDIWKFQAQVKALGP